MVDVQGLMRVPNEGALALLLLAAALQLFSTTSLGIVIATVSRTVPQIGLLLMLTLLTLQMAHRHWSPSESMPQFLQDIMLAAPTTHFVSAGNAILFRGAGLDVVWPQLLATAVIGAGLFGVALGRFRRTLAQAG